MQQETHKYMLEIYEPGSTKDCWVAFSSDSPFMSIQVGELLNPQIWEPAPNPGIILQVVNVEHIIWQLEGREARHKICVFTEAVEDDSDARLTYKGLASHVAGEFADRLQAQIDERDGD